jgi:hypothetical protein
MASITAGGWTLYPTRRLGYEKPAYNVLKLPFFQDTPTVLLYCAANLGIRRCELAENRWNSTYTGATPETEGLTWQRFPDFPPVHSQYRSE